MALPEPEHLSAKKAPVGELAVGRLPVGELPVGRLSAGEALAEGAPDWDEPHGPPAVPGRQTPAAECPGTPLAAPPEEAWLGGLLAAERARQPEAACPAADRARRHRAFEGLERVQKPGPENSPRPGLLRPAGR